MRKRGPRLIALAVTAALAVIALPAVPAAADTPLPAPSQPVASQITSTGAVLTWTSGGGPVFRYSMKRLVNGEWQGYASMPGPSITLAGLTPDTEYTFAVYAAALPFSGYTVSPLSEPVTFRTLSANPTCRVQIGAGNGVFVMNGTADWTGTPQWSWRVTFTTTANQRITQSWNGNLTVSGAQVTITGGSSGGPLPQPGTPVTFGASGQYTGVFTPPQDIRFNGVPCEVTVSPW